MTKVFVFAHIMNLYRHDEKCLSQQIYVDITSICSIFEVDIKSYVTFVFYPVYNFFCMNFSTPVQ